MCRCLQLLVFVFTSPYFTATVSAGDVNAAVESVNPSTVKEVVLLHGLKRSAWAMKKLERALSKSGYQVCNINYPSDKHPVGYLVNHIELEITRCFETMPEQSHFVSHSLGGIMIRALQVTGRGPKVARAVMLAPPNHGSELVDAHRNSALFGRIMGPIAHYLGTDPGSLPLRLGPATFEVGIIAGTARSNPLGSWIFNEPSDGTVSVESARLEGMKDFIEVPYGHSFIMRKRAVIYETEYFLRHGEFSETFKPQPL